MLRKDAETTVEETDDVKVMIADGKLIVLARYPDTAPGPEAEGTVGARQDGWLLNEVPGEFDATHGEADPD